MSPQIGRRGYCAKYVHTADPVGMGGKSRQYAIFLSNVQARLSSYWTSCMYLA